MTTTTPARPDATAAVAVHDRDAAAAAAPPGPRRRLLGVDAARGVALIGMIAVHTLPDLDPAGQPTWVARVAEGTSAAAFALLAGIGVAFMTRRRRVRFWTEGAGVAAGLVARALVIGAIGLLLGGVADAELDAVILPYYAVLFVLAIPLVLLPTGALFGLGTVLVVGAPALDHVLAGQLPVPRGDNPTLGWLLTDPLGLLSELTVTGYYPALIWLVYLCFGLALGRLDLGSRTTARCLVLVGVPVAVAAQVVSNVLLTKYGGLAAIEASAAAARMDPAALHEALTVGPDGITPPGTWWWEALATAHSSTPLDLLYTLGVGAALLGVMLLLGHLVTPGVRTLVAAVRVPLAAAGSMTLTMYTAHLLFLNLGTDLDDPDGIFVLQAVLAPALALCWWATAGRGPLETLTTAASDRARRPFSRSTRQPISVAPK